MDGNRYRAIHARLRRKRGRAAGMPCTDCDGTAIKWSWRHDTDPEDLNNYDPRCKQCHVLYDQMGLYSRSDETKSKLAGSMKGNSNGAGNKGQKRPKISEGQRGNIRGKGKPKPGTSAAMKLRWQDPEYRARMTGRRTCEGPSGSSE